VPLDVPDRVVHQTKPWREYPAFEYNDFPVPPDYQQKT
jgi:hypothetical protein